MADGSTETMTFATRLRRAAAKLDYLQKTGKNAHFKYSFVTEAHVKEKVKAALESEGLTLTMVTFEPLGACDGKAATLRCTVTIQGDDGYGHGVATFQGVGSGTDSSDKAPMKACAAALKYALTCGFLIPTGDDPEADELTDRSEADGTQQAPAVRVADPTPVNEETMLARINTAPNAAGLASLKLDITAFQARDKAAFDRLTAAFRAKNRELTK